MYKFEIIIRILLLCLSLKSYSFFEIHVNFTEDFNKNIGKYYLDCYERLNTNALVTLNILNLGVNRFEYLKELDSLSLKLYSVNLRKYISNIEFKPLNNFKYIISAEKRDGKKYALVLKEVNLLDNEKKE